MDSRKNGIGQANTSRVKKVEQLRVCFSCTATPFPATSPSPVIAGTGDPFSLARGVCEGFRLHLTKTTRCCSSLIFEQVCCHNFSPSRTWSDTPPWQSVASAPELQACQDQALGPRGGQKSEGRVRLSDGVEGDGASF